LQYIEEIFLKKAAPEPEPESSEEETTTTKKTTRVVKYIEVSKTF